MISFGGAVLSRGSRGLCSLALVSGTLGMKHLVAQFGLTVMSTCLGLGLTHLVIIRSSGHTPSLRTGNVQLLLISIISNDVDDSTNSNNSSNNTNNDHDNDRDNDDGEREGDGEDEVK
jgi:hypothetical protein